MKMIALLTFLSSSMAFALNTNFCPSRVMTMIKIEKVFKTSIYSQTPGWKEAQKNLAQASLLQVTYNLKEKRNGRCLYADYNGQNVATLATTQFLDPETSETNSSTQLIMNYKIQSSNYVSYVPVKTVAVSGLTPYQNPYKVKVKAKLRPANSGKAGAYDMGTVLIGIQ